MNNESYIIETIPATASPEELCLLHTQQSICFQDIKIVLDQNIISPDKIREGVTILGVTGTNKGS